jgi:hypothetical protein
MKEITILRSKFTALVDDEDYTVVSTYKWYLYPYRAPTFYTCTGGSAIPIFMHRLVFPSPPGFVTAHRSENGLDNRKSNLIHITNLENLQRKRKYSNNTSGVPGVKKRTYLDRPRWEAQITVYKKRMYLGVFSSFDEACEARFNAEIKYKPDWTGEHYGSIHTAIQGDRSSGCDPG